MNEENLTCIYCNGKEFEVQDVPLFFEPSIEFVVTPCLVCKNCEKCLMTTEQMNEFRIRTDAYTVVRENRISENGMPKIQK